MNRDRFSVILLLIYIAIIFVTGGSSRADEPAQIVNHIAAIIFGAVAAARISLADLQRIRGPLFIIVALIFVGIIQLVPLPPHLWAILPGHQPLDRISDLAGLRSIWRPLSLTPAMTLDVIFSFFPPLAAVLLWASVPGRHWPIVVIALLLFISASALLGLLQAATSQYQLYGFRITGFAGANGLLANRNHQAVLLICALPIWAILWPEIRKTHAWLAPSAIAFLLVLACAILATGSRAGLMLATVAAAATWWTFRVPSQHKGHDRRSLLPILCISLAVCGIAIMVILFPPIAFERIFQASTTQEFRFRLLLPLLQIGWQYFPFGTGFGSFVDVYKLHEPLDNLGIQYLNHAHDDLVELFIEGGFAALAVLVGAGGWIFRSIRKVGYRIDSSGQNRFSQAGSIIVVTILLASLFDYPLRTPLLGVVFTIGLCWLSGNSGCRSERIT
jgi:hypothetical protein